MHASDVASGKTPDPAKGLWEVEELATKIRAIQGVLEVGIFSGPTGPESAALGQRGGQKPVACYFGMADGTVTVRTAKSVP